MRNDNPMNKMRGDHPINKIMIGILMGAIYPVVAFLVIEQLFALLTKFELVADVGNGLGFDQRQRTMFLFALVAAILPLQLLSNRKWDQAIRGFMLPMAIYIGAWIWKYGSYLMAHF